MKDRILKFLQTENKTSSQFAEEIGVQPSGISHILSGRNIPSLDFIIKMLEKYEFLSTEWLLFGRGPMYSSGSAADLFSRMEDGSRESAELSEISGQESRENEGSIDVDQNIADIVRTTSDNGLNDNDLRKIERIIWFYSDDSFREFFPGRST